MTGGTVKSVEAGSDVTRDPHPVTLEMIEAGEDVLPELDGSLWSPDRADVVERIYRAMKALDPDFAEKSA